MAVIPMRRDVSEIEQHYHFLEMGDKAHKGEEVVITRDGQPWLRLTPCPSYTPPTRKSREELRDEFLAKLSESEKKGLRDLSLALERDKPMAYLPERELCEECLARYKAQFLPAEPDSP